MLYAFTGVDSLAAWAKTQSVAFELGAMTARDVFNMAAQLGCGVVVVDSAGPIRAEFTPRDLDDNRSKETSPVN